MTQWGLDTLFNPAKRHMDEEKRRLQSTREEIGDSSGGKRIDLESGKVTIRRENETGRPTAETEPEQTTGKASDKPAVGGAAVRAAKRRGDNAAPSAAAVRAAQRRGRQPR
jgi:hypothetical protein